MIFDVFRKNTHGVITPEEAERRLRAGTVASTGISVTPETASRFGAVFACVRVRAESLGQLPIHLMEQRGREKHKAVDHELYPLLHDAPNEAMTSQEFWEWVSASLDLRGNAYVFINRANGRIFELLPLDASWVTPKLDKSRSLYYEVRIPTAEGALEVKRYTANEILHFKLMSLRGGYVGASVIEQARDTIGLGLALEQHGARFFRQGATPGGVLQTDQLLDDDTYKRLQESWEERHQGIDNAHRIAILEAGLKWQQVGMPLKDAQFLEGRKFQRSEICGLFRVPPHFIGDLDKATFSNIEHQGLEFVIHGLMPTIVRCERRISLQLIPPDQRRRFYAKFNVAGLLRGDMAARANYYEVMERIGVLSPNEIRELEDMNPRNGGDIYLTPMNMNTTDGAQPEGDE